MVMCATILEVNQDNLLVRDNSSSQEVVVNTSNVCNLRAGDRVRILYNGIMTRSLPPQISAIRIFRMPSRRRF